jgi:hypothetical protein
LKRVVSDLAQHHADTAKCLDLYKVMLPAATLDCYLPRSFYLKDLGLWSGEHLDTLIRLNYVSQVPRPHDAPWSVSDPGVKLNEHPFQVRSLLERVNDENVPLIRELSDAHLNSDNSTLDSIVLSRFVVGGGDFGSRLDWLYHHAEWSGIPRCLLATLQSLQIIGRNKSLDKAFEFSVLRYLWKQQRRVFRHNDLETMPRLARQLSDWKKLRDEALSAVDFKARHFRLDAISYEIAYLHLLFGNFEEAAEFSNHSFSEGLAAIARGAGNAPGGVEWIDGKWALSYIWVTFNVKQRCEFFRTCDRFIRGSSPEELQPSVRELHANGRRMLEALGRANAIEASQSGQAYFEALKSINAATAIDNCNCLASPRA